MNPKRLVSIVCSLLAVASHTQGGLIGTLPTLQHRVSGQFYIIDSKTLFFEDFNYDGLGPGAFLYYYRPGVAVDRRGGGVIIPLPSSVGTTSGRYPGSFQRRSFNNEDFTVTLPDGTDACDIGTITVWCQPFTAIFTQLEVPRDTFVNGGSDPCTLVGAAVTEIPTAEFDNCKVLHDTLHLSWKVDNDNSQVRFQLCGCTATDPSTIQYLGFGLSGSSALTLMFGADATIAWVDGNGMAQAQDYYLSSYVQCRGGSGACPDTVDTTTGSRTAGTCSDDVSDVSGFVQERQQCISFTRPFNPSDSGTCDRAIDPTNQNQYIVWGIGSLGETAFQHHTRASVTDDPIHLGRAPMDECAGVQLMCQQCDPFPSRQFIAREDTTFVATIGPAANPRGYTAITGQPGWGIAWYINDTLVPELVVERGRTYTFLVHGGNVSADDANYHPFYITNSMNGGRLLNTQQEMMSETVYAGFNEENQPTAAGPLCERTETSVSEALRQSCSPYSEYFSSLDSTCQPGEPAKLVWTPDENTPDLVYYQCASHLNLGWRITVMGSATPVSTSPPAATSIPSATTGPPQPQFPPPPRNVQAFCSHAIWRTPLGFPCGDILRYDVRLFNPTTKEEALRQASADGTFYSLRLLDDDPFIHEDTQVQVRLVTSELGAGMPSEAISLGCPPPEEPAPSLYFELKGKVFTNNSIININTIGQGDEALLCKTDKVECCSTAPDRAGEFYYPNGVQVPINRAREGFYRNRGDQLIRLNRRAGAMSPTGLYRCEIPNKDGVTQKMFITLAPAQE